MCENSVNSHPFTPQAMQFAGLVSLAMSALALCHLPVAAMGGHFDADDAVMLAPGRCQVEIWAIATRSRSSTEHLGPACRVGPVELGLSLDRARENGATAHLVGAQLKWAVDSVLPQVSLGLVASVGRDLRQSSGVSGSLFAPITWFANDQLQVHFNLGLDRDGSGGTFRRKGLAGEWAASDRVTLIGELLRSGGQRSARVGVRIGLAEFTSLDFSTLHSSASSARRLAVGLNHEFGR